MPEKTAPSSLPNSVPVLRRALTLHSLHSIKVYERTWRRVDYNLYLSTILVRVGGAAHRFRPEIAAVEAAIEACFTGVEQYFLDKLAALQARLPGADATPAVAYSQPATVEALARTPAAGRFLALLEQLERACRLIDQAWFAGRLNAEQQLQHSTEVARQLTRLSARINTLARGLARRVLNADDQANTAYDDLLGRQGPPAPGPAASDADRDAADGELEPGQPVDPENLVARLASLAAVESADTADTPPETLGSSGPDRATVPPVTSVIDLAVPA